MWCWPTAVSLCSSSTLPARFAHACHPSTSDPSQVGDLSILAADLPNRLHTSWVLGYQPTAFASDAACMIVGAANGAVTAHIHPGGPRYIFIIILTVHLVYRASQCCHSAVPAVRCQAALEWSGACLSELWSLPRHTGQHRRISPGKRSVPAYCFGVDVQLAPALHSLSGL